ncbi:MAG: LysR substrate-binding domain-containing protein [Pseudomonadota bacterium]
MPATLPSITAIRVFEAAARHGNFTRAAAELGMSQASVSYQIKVLEERVGTPLFLRRPRHLSLTRAGERLAGPTIDAFERLRAAYATADLAEGRTLTISTTPTFATNWLAARLGRFQMENPDLAVRVRAEGANVDFGREEVDVAIRYGRGAWEGLAAHELMRSAFTPMLSPGLLKRLGAGAEPADLLGLRIIVPADPYWAIWLAQAGVEPGNLGARIGSDLESQMSEAQAAIAGLGVAMLTPRFFRYELETGRLVQPFGLIGTDGRGYWLVYPEARRTVTKIARFRAWLQAEAARDSETAPEEAEGAGG